MSNLVAQQDSAAASAAISCDEDAAAWGTFDLSNGPDFNSDVDSNNNVLNFVAIWRSTTYPHYHDTADSIYTE